MSKAAHKDRGKILALLREITGSSSLESARKRLSEAVDALTDTHPKVAELLDEHGEEMLAVYALPEQHRKRMKSTNMLERFNKEIKRRTRVVCIFPNEAACVRLVSALAIEQNEEWMELKYLNMESEGNLQCVTGGIQLMSCPLPITEALLSQ